MNLCLSTVPVRVVVFCRVLGRACSSATDARRAYAAIYITKWLYLISIYAVTASHRVLDVTTDDSRIYCRTGRSLTALYTVVSLALHTTWILSIGTNKLQSQT